MTVANRTIRRKTRAPVVIDPTNPRAVAACDGCGFPTMHHKLVKRMAYRGGSVPVWDGMLVCGVCDDVPNTAPQFSRLTLLPDPVPVLNPRPDVPTPSLSGYGYWVDSNGDYVNTVDSNDTWGGEYVQTISDWEMLQ